MAGQNNLSIADQEFIDAGKELNAYGEVLLRMLENYSRCVETICEQAINDRLINTKLINLCNEVSCLQDPLAEIVEEATKICQKYVGDIDAADKFLY